MCRGKFGVATYDAQLFTPSQLILCIWWRLCTLGSYIQGHVGITRGTPYGSGQYGSCTDINRYALDCRDRDDGVSPAL